MLRLSFRIKLMLGLYLIGLVTAVVLLTVYCILCLQTEMDRVRKVRTAPLRSFQHFNVNLPTALIYKNHVQVVRKTEHLVLLKNSLEDDILNLPWIQELHEIVVRSHSSVTPQVNLVVADWRNVELLLNWLIAALVRLTDPLQNVIVLGLDAEVCELLHSRNFNCVHSDPDSFIRHSKDKFFRFANVYSAPQTRLLVARLVNYWGYSFASYDTDAVILRNPQPLYDQNRGVNVVAGAGGHWPRWAMEKWGFAVCPGAMLMRSGPKTEELWLCISKSWGAWGSEQDQFNRAIKLHMSWNTTFPNRSSSAFCRHKNGWRGVSQKLTDLSFVLLPPSQFCRGECCDEALYDLSGVYVAHEGGGNIGNVTGKVRKLRENGVWFLGDNWREVTERTAAVGVAWLEQLYISSHL